MGSTHTDAARQWPSREEWMARAEEDTRVIWYESYGREQLVDPTRYLTAAELAEAQRLADAIAREVRRRCTREIRRLRAVVGPIPVRGGEKMAWYRGLDAETEDAAGTLRELELMRRDLGRAAKRCSLVVGRECVHQVLARAVRSLAGDLRVDDVRGVSAFNALAERYQQRYAAAAEQALADSIAREVARRRTDAAWDTELRRRAWIETPVDPSTCVHRVALRRATARQEHPPGFFVLKG